MAARIVVILPEERLRAPVTALVEDDVEEHDLSLGPEQSPPEDGVNDHSERYPDQERDQAHQDCVLQCHLPHHQLHQQDCSQEQSQLSSEHEYCSRCSEYEPVRAGPEPETERYQDWNESHGVGQSSGTVEHQVKLRHCEQRQPGADT